MKVIEERSESWTVTPNPNPNDSGTDLAKEFGGEMTMAQSGYNSSLKVLKVQDEMLGSLMDITG
jgi:flagellar hook-associated protein FlgK